MGIYNTTREKYIGRYEQVRDNIIMRNIMKDNKYINNLIYYSNKSCNNNCIIIIIIY